MLESLEYPTVLEQSSENPFGADNQQGRLDSSIENPQRLHAELQLRAGRRYSPFLIAI
jgi:hypothetical protein